MRHKVSVAACFALLLTLTLAAEAYAEGTLSKVRSFFKGRTRSTITGVVDRDGDATIFKAEDGKTFTLDGRQAERLVEAHKGATVRITGYAQNERFEVRRFELVEAAPAAKPAEETGDEERDREIAAAEEEEEEAAPAPVRRRPTKPARRTAAAADEDEEHASASGETRSYTVEKGDTLAGISKKFYGTTKHWGAIQKHNNIKDVKTIKPGMVLEIPAM